MSRGSKNLQKSSKNFFERVELGPFHSYLNVLYLHESSYKCIKCLAVVLIVLRLLHFCVPTLSTIGPNAELHQELMAKLDNLPLGKTSNYINSQDTICFI